MIEKWKPIKGYEDLYEVSNLGNIKNSKGKILKSALCKNGYRSVSLWKKNKGKTYFIHRLVAEAFVLNYENKTDINHKDGNKENNKADNLEWCTRKQNIHHSWKNGLSKKVMGEKHHRHKLTQDDVNYIRQNYIAGHAEFGAFPLAKKFNVKPCTISNIVAYRKWKVRI